MIMGEQRSDSNELSDGNRMNERDTFNWTIKAVDHQIIRSEEFEEFTTLLC